MRNIRLTFLSILAMLASAATFSSCSNDTSDNAFVVTIKPYNGNNKVYIDGEGYSCWNHGDPVFVNNNTYYLELDNHTCRINGVAPSASGSYTAVFPADIVGEGSVLNGTAISGLTLPATQTYQLDGFNHQIVQSYMAAYLGAYNGMLEFANAGIALSINITNNFSRPILLSQVIVSDNLAPLSGTFSIAGLADGTPSLVAASNTNDTLVEMNIPDGILLAPGNSTSVMVVLPPTDSYTGNKFTICVRGYDQDHLLNGVNTLYEFTQRQNSEASGCIPRNIMAQVPVSLNSPRTMVLKGQGSFSNPYKIYSPADLRTMQHLVNGGYLAIGNCQDYVSALYYLMNDIDMQGITLAPIGTDVNGFSGYFYGCGHTISNLSVSGSHSAGLFGYLTYGGSVSYLSVDNATITASADKDIYCGVICGRVGYAAIVDRCKISGTCTMNTGTGSAYIGGIAGEIINSTISNVKCGAFIDHSNGSVHHFVGGIVGNVSSNGDAINAYTISTTHSAIIDAGQSTAGGIAGRCEQDGNIRIGYFGYSNTIIGNASRTADICGFNNGGNIRYFFYPHDTPIANTTQEQYLYQYTPISSNYTYLFDGNYTVISLLNSAVDAYRSQFSLSSWTQADYATGPELFFDWNE
ncbi:MAG: hypothetical protein KBT28_11745 [Bacteroidales bacterium]|nr:hypothetical protein [Candidatus Colimorpha merdihippi]